MADAASADEPSLSDSFNLKSLWSWSHILMMGSMFLMAIPVVAAAIPAASAASIGAAGWLDPVVNFLKMYISGYENLSIIPDFVSAASQSASQGIYYTGAASSHVGHVAAAGADMVGHCTTEAFNSTLSGMSAADFAFNQELAKSAGGDMVGQLEGLCHGVK